jgi:hypothetical protein
MPTKLPPVEYLRECFDLDESTGTLTWRIRPISHFQETSGRRKAITTCRAWNATHAGKIAGHDDCHERGRVYRRITLNGKQYRIHRIVLFMTTGQEPPEVDHRNCDGSDNAPGNLRGATREQNTLNSRARSTNRSGLKGVLSRDDGMFSAQIGHERKAIYLGLFRTAEEAHTAYLRASDILHGKFGRTA